MPISRPWDYLIVTAANDQQARSYELQLRQREQVGPLRQVRHCLVVPDIDGRRIGSGGSTLHCLTRVLEWECSADGVRSFAEAEAVLSGLRILIVHAGGDSRRLPPYSHCGKMFVPLPARTCPHTTTTLFDRLVPTFLNLPDGPGGQVVIASGDALILFDPSAVDLSRPGITAFGSWAPAPEAANHGVFCTLDDGSVTRYLQKPSPEEQVRAGAVNDSGQSVLDLGVMSCDAAAVVQMMRAFFSEPSQAGGSGLAWRKRAYEVLLSHGIDLYREICCGLGSSAKFVHYVQNLRGGGAWLEAALTSEWFRSLHEIRLQVCVLPEAKFFHFGTTRQLITSGAALLKEDLGKSPKTALMLNNEIHGGVVGTRAWVEGCSIDARLVLEGMNVVVGADIAEPLSLPRGACIDLSRGTNRGGETVWFLRCYDINDSFKHSAEVGGTFCGSSLGQWVGEMGGGVSDVWDAKIRAGERTLWNARVFPALREHQEFREWLWMFHAGSATAEQKRRYWAAERYSSSEIAVRVDQLEFMARRSRVASKAVVAGSTGATPAGANLGTD